MEKNKKKNKKNPTQFNQTSKHQNNFPIQCFFFLFIFVAFAWILATTRRCSIIFFRTEKHDKHEWGNIDVVAVVVRQAKKKKCAVEKSKRRNNRELNLI